MNTTEKKVEDRAAVWCQLTCCPQFYNEIPWRVIFSRMNYYAHWLFHGMEIMA